MNISRNLVLWVIISIMIVTVFYLFQAPTSRAPSRELSFTEFMASVEGNEVNSVTIQGNNITGTTRDGSQFHTYAPDDPSL